MKKHSQIEQPPNLVEIIMTHKTWRKDRDELKETVAERRDCRVNVSVERLSSVVIDTR